MFSESYKDLKIAKKFTFLHVQTLIPFPSNTRHRGQKLIIYLESAWFQLSNDIGHVSHLLSMSSPFLINNFIFRSTLTSLLLNTFLLPFLILPVVGGHPSGLFTHLGIPVTWQVFIGFGSIARKSKNPNWIKMCIIPEVGCSMVIVFENQQNHVVGNGIKLESKSHRRIFAVVNIILGFTFVLPVLLQVPDQEKARRNVMKVSHPPVRLKNEIFTIFQHKFRKMQQKEARKPLKSTTFGDGRVFEFSRPPLKKLVHHSKLSVFHDRPNFWQEHRIFSYFQPEWTHFATMV